MTEKPKRWGHGRIIFMSDLPAIRDEISRAIPLTEVFASRSDRLGIGYSAFCKLVARYAIDAKIRPVARPTTNTPTQQQPGTANAASKPAGFAEDYDGAIDHTRLGRLTGTKPRR